MPGKAKGRAPKIPKFTEKEAKLQFEKDLIEFVHQEKLIWRPDDRDYNKTDKRSKLFESFAKRYKEAQITGPSCALLWKSLRQQYKKAKERKKQARSGKL